MQRRKFVQLLAAGLIFRGNITAAKVIQRETSAIKYCIAATNHLGQHSVSILTADAQQLMAADMPSRRHSFAFNQRQQHLLCVGRRPSVDIQILDTAGQQQQQVLAAPGRHFYGHAVFSADQRYLYTSENDFINMTGVIGVRDAQDSYRLLDEFPSGGIGPHEIALTEDGQRLLIANGGVATHPNSGRKKLNLSTMHSSLAIVNAHSGALLHRYQLPLEQRHNSIRHIAVRSSTNGCLHIVMALQNQNPDKTHEVLLASYTEFTEPIDSCLKALTIPSVIADSLNSYVGDVVFDQSQQYFAASAPRGNRVLIYRASGEYLAAVKLNDACGLNATTDPGEFVVTTGTGQVVKLAAAQQWTVQLLAIDHFKRWDNHLQPLC